MEDEGTIEYNFWPVFSDLMLTLVLVMVLVLFVFGLTLALNDFDIRNVKERQKDTITSLAAELDQETTKEGDNKYGLCLRGYDCPDICIENDATLQRITFSDHILFNVNKFELNEQGRIVLGIFGEILSKRKDMIREIQIHGHADNTRPADFDDPGFNLSLASERAISVFRFFQESVEIDPAEFLMSATSFGEYKPVQRDINDSLYSNEKLNKHNETDSMRRKNRRIELLLYYRR